MPDRDDYMVQGNVSDPNQRAYDGSESYPPERADRPVHSTGGSDLGAGSRVIASPRGDNHHDRVACGLCPWARVENCRSTSMR